MADAAMDAAARSGETVDAGDEGIACYIDEVPDFVEAELVRLYDSLHSSLAFFRVFRPAGKLSCYLACRNGRPVTILLFRFADGKIEVLNEMIAIGSEELRRFARYMFGAFPAAGIISFKAVRADTTMLPFPVQRCNAKDTYVIALPDTPEAYRTALGKSTRTGVRYQLNKVMRDHPTFVSRFYAREEIEEEHVREILRLSAERISSTAFRFAHDEDRILALLRECGFVHVLFIDGRVCAGSINYLVGTGCFGEAIGQTCDYEKYGLGKLTVYLTVCESIARGARRFYLGGGRFAFKSRMLGVQEDMDRLEIYRSWPAMLLHLDNAGKVAVGGHVRRLKTWLRRNEENAVARFAIRSFYSLKNLGKKDRQ